MLPSKGTPLGFWTTVATQTVYWKSGKAYIISYKYVDDARVREHESVWLFCSNRQVEGETRVGVFAARQIEAGEPLTYDYRSSSWPFVSFMCL